MAHTRVMKLSKAAEAALVIYGRVLRNALTSTLSRVIVGLNLSASRSMLA